MKHRFTFLLAFVVAVMVPNLIVLGAAAQNLKSGRADVPFTFSANHQVLEAGCYQVKLLSDAILGLVNCETGKTVGVMVHTANGYPAIRNGSLVFNVTARGYRLTHVRFAGVNIQSDLSVQPKPERVLAQNEASKTIEVAIR